MTDRSPDQLAREVREALTYWNAKCVYGPDGGQKALAALAVLQAQAEAGQRVIETRRTLRKPCSACLTPGIDFHYPGEKPETCDDCRAAASSFPPVPGETT